MGKLIVVGAALWAFFLSPTLCQGGLFPHPCDCSASLSCSHEDGCSLDPCPASIAPQGDGASTSPHAARLLAAVPAAAPHALAPPRVVAQPPHAVLIPTALQRGTTLRPLLV